MGLCLSSSELDVVNVLAYILSLDARVKYEHCAITAILAYEMAKLLNINSVDEIFIAGLLHDLGVFDISVEKLHDIVDFSQTEDIDILKHPSRGASILGDIPCFSYVAKIILQHHEWYDGSGYPCGLKGDEILLEAQIIRAADHFAFLFSENDSSHTPLLKQMSERVGREYSEEIFSTLCSVVTEKFFLKITDFDHLHKNVDEILASMSYDQGGTSLSRLALLQLLGKVLSRKHQYSQEHSKRVADYASILALASGYPTDKLDNLRSAAYLHDIGKLAIPEKILNKPGRLNDEEFRIIQSHAELSAKIVSKLGLFKNIIDTVGSDQELWDGSGYPKGLAGERIPLEARIILIADAYDAMTTTRSYRVGMAAEDAKNELRACSGKDFDPALVELACKLF